MGNKLVSDVYLTENDIEFLEANTKFTREKIVQWHLAFLKDCPSGKLDKEQFIKLFKQLEPSDKKIEKYCDFVFYAFDTDNSGTIEFTEFLIAFNIKSKGSLEDRLNWTFNIYDLDKSGEIDTKELTKMFELLFTVLNVNKKDEKYNIEKRVNDILKRFDLNGNKKLSREEFITGLKQDECLRKLLLDHELIK